MSPIEKAATLRTRAAGLSSASPAAACSTAGAPAGVVDWAATLDFFTGADFAATLGFFTGADFAATLGFFTGADFAA
ncbi:MAG: hypothetical protein OEM84_12850, partial [Acidimicrobiia bacterium]|nr:hypothetical protein [Acidimicrobiia bacterium]